MRQKVYLILLILGVLAFGFYLINNKKPFLDISNVKFARTHRNICEFLFSDPPFDKFQMSAKYFELFPIYEVAVNSQKVNGKFEEGFSAQIPDETKTLHLLAQSPFVRTICETGFNYGHSSFNFLTANPDAVVHSFDLGTHAYVKVMADKLSRMFPGRINVHFGDSTATVPEFLKENPGVACDLIFVDGGHVFPVALADLKNLGGVASKPNNIVVFDDYPTDWGRGFGAAWELLVRNATIEEDFRCTTQKNYRIQRGFVSGKFV